MIAFLRERKSIVNASGLGKPLKDSLAVLEAGVERLS